MYASGIGDIVEPIINGYTGGFTPTYANAFGVDLSPYYNKGLRFTDLLGMGVVTEADLAPLFGDRSTWRAGYDPYDVNGGIYTTNVDSFTPKDLAAFNQAIAEQMATPVAPQPAEPARYLIDGRVVDDAGNLVEGMQPTTTSPVSSSPSSVVSTVYPAPDLPFVPDASVPGAGASSTVLPVSTIPFVPVPVTTAITPAPGASAPSSIVDRLMSFAKTPAGMATLAAGLYFATRGRRGGR